MLPNFDEEGFISRNDVAEMPPLKSSKHFGDIGATVPERQVIEFAGGRISFLEWKSQVGAPTLVFAHANGFNANTYRTLLSPLSENFRVVALDMRGHGMTELPLDEARLAGWSVYSDDLAGFVERISAHDVILAGHSLGATTSLMTAARGLRSLRAVILVEPVLPPFALSLFALVARRVGRSDVLPLVGKALGRRPSFASREAALTAFRGRGGFRTWPDDQVIRDYIEGGTVADPAGVKLSCRPQWEAANFSIFPFGITRLARQIDVPLTVLTAEQNSSAPSRQLGALVRGHDSAQVVQVPGTTHFLPMEKPEVVRAEIVATAKRAELM